MYIEVQIADEIIEMGGVAMPSAPPSELEMTGTLPIAVASVVSRSPAERLAELNNIRELLTDAEFEFKRREILESL
eukprot:CAMPEP_0172520422 /NCGR_PEP_ID=MMETSP1066-20121228/291993_1 /TAXON_ID=671091 /ORGANISM="Coscinodiscus wailesii, Strain CCMP2513" /LENGTH=75 /DNA_ID=CAMNT_0013303173 /DNA_START=799 /DNA_END=1026 /DNA_ORIENTATION=+